MVHMGAFRYNVSNWGSGRPYFRGKATPYRTDDNAFIVLNGTKLVFASEVERFTHVKHDYAFPLQPLMIYQDNCSRLGLECAKCFDGIYSSKRDHHMSHIYESFYQSGFKESAVLVNDGYGSQEECVTLAYIEEGKEPLILKKFDNWATPSGIYGMVARELFNDEHPEGKLMGLAGYGKSTERKYLWWDEQDKRIDWDRERLREDIRSCKSSEEWNEEGVLAARDIAFEFQKNYEEVLVEIVKHFASLLDNSEINTSNLCLSGGGILNCPTNSRIVDLNLFKNYYASPQPGDGCAESVGRAISYMKDCGEELESHRLSSPYLGMKYPANELTGSGTVLSAPITDIMSHIEKGGVVAWYQGRAEYGPRALGHRSFLADPQNPEMLDALNKIKGRENWRPLAPIVPEELFKRIFEVENTDMCEFMLRTLKIKEKWRPTMRAVCHIDGTTRPQCLKRSTNPKLYDLLMAYFEKNHVPCLINTSLNINGFPIVETPRDLCDLAEEITFMDDVSDVMTVFVDDTKIYRVEPEKPEI